MRSCKNVILNEEIDYYVDDIKKEFKCVIEIKKYNVHFQIK